MLTSYDVTIENIYLVNDFSDSTSTMYLFNYHIASDLPYRLSIKYNKYFAWLYSGIFGNSFYSNNKYNISNCNVSAYVGIKPIHWEEYDPNKIYNPVQQKKFNDYVYYNKYYMCYGGLIGAVIFSNNVVIESCQFNGNIGYGLTGGIVGCIAYSQCTISNCKTNILRIENRGDSEENDITTMYNIDLTNTVGEISTYPDDLVTQDDMKYLKKISNRYNTYVSGGIVGLLYMSVGTSYKNFIDTKNNINFNIGQISDYMNNKFVIFDINNTNSDWKLFYENGYKSIYLNSAYYIASDIYDTLTSMLYLYSNVMEFKDSDNNIFKFPDTTINTDNNIDNNIDNKKYPSIINCDSTVDSCSSNSGSIVGHLINSSIINCSGRVSGSLVGRYSQTMPPKPPAKQGDPIDYTKQLYSVSHFNDNISCYISNCISSIEYRYDFTKGLICREFAGADDPTKKLIIVTHCLGMYITNGQININFNPPGNNSKFPDNISFYSNGINGIDPNYVYNYYNNLNHNIISYSRDTNNKSAFFYIDIRNFIYQIYNDNYKIYLVPTIKGNITRVDDKSYLLKYTSPLLDITNDITLDKLDKLEFKIYLKYPIPDPLPDPSQDPTPTPNFDPAPSGNDIIISDITMNITVINKFDPIAIDGNFIINKDFSNSVNLNTLYTCYPLTNKDNITVSILSQGKCGGLLQSKCAFKINKYTDSTGKIEYDLEYNGLKINKSGEILLAINEKNGKNQYNFKVSYITGTDKTLLQPINSLNIIDNYENTNTKTVMKRMISNEENILKSIYSGLVISNPDQNTEISNYNYVPTALSYYMNKGSNIDNTSVKFKSLYSFGMIKDVNGTHPILFWTSANNTNEFKIKEDVNKNINSFTGQHIVKPSTRFVHKNIDKLYGKIVSSIGTYNNYLLQNNKANINDSMPIIELSNKEKDKRVIGVITNKTNNGNKYNDKDFFNNKYIKINSLGDGMLWVSNINGNFEAGDFITTSKIEGIGQRQDDNICYNYTVAKITSDLDFKNSNNVKEIKLDTQLIKFKLVECIYLCG